MKKLICFSLALALSFSLLACGTKNNSVEDGANAGGSANNTTAENQTQPSVQPEADQEGEKDTPDNSEESATESEEGEKNDESSGAEEGTESEEATGDAETEGEETPVVINASHSDVTFNAAGKSFKLTASELPESVQTVTYASQDESVATVAEDGTVTAVAPGTTNVVMTLTFDDGTTSEFTCIVRCSWTEESEENDAEVPSAPTTASVDLAAFFASYMESLGENAPFMMPVEGEVLDMYYSGLSAFTFKQSVVQMAGMSAVPFEFAMLELENAGDVDAVKAILQSRVDYQASGGAWYPETVAAWEKAEIIVVGNYVAMIVAGEQQADAVDAFKALFN